LWTLRLRTTGLRWKQRACDSSLDEWTRVMAVAVYDRVRCQIGERLNGKRWVEAASHGRECGTPHDEQIWHIPALGITVHDGIPGIAAHACSAHVVAAGRASGLGCAPHQLCACRVADLFEFARHEFSSREFIRPP